MRLARVALSAMSCKPHRRVSRAASCTCLDCFSNISWPLLAPRVTVCSASRVRRHLSGRRLSCIQSPSRALPVDVITLRLTHPCVAYRTQHLAHTTRFIPLDGTLKRGTFSPIFGVCVEKVSNQGYGTLFFCWWGCVPRKASHQKKGGGTFLVEFELGQS